MTPKRISELLGITTDEADLINKIAENNKGDDEEIAAHTLEIINSKEEIKTHDSLIKKEVVEYWDDGNIPISKLTLRGFGIYKVLVRMSAAS